MATFTLSQYDSIFNQNRNQTRSQYISACQSAGAPDDAAAIGKLYDDKKKALAPTNNTNNNNNRNSSSSAGTATAAAVTSLLGAFTSNQTPQFTNQEVTDPETMFKKLSEGGLSFTNLLKTGGTEILEQLKRENQLRTDINEKIGISGRLSQSLRNEIVDSTPEAIKFGYSMDHIQEMVSEIMTGTGRFNMISRETIERSFATSRAFVGSLGEMGKLFTEFEKVGIGASNAMDAIDRAGKGSLSLGLRSKDTVADMRKQIERLNEFGFKNGIDGLAKMSRIAKEFRMDMDNTFTFAEKVMSPEGAVSMAANLSVLGAGMGALADPMKMMYMSTNNVEGLQEALINATKSLATFNEQSGKFEIIGVNMRRAREMAKEMGIDYATLTRTAIAAQERMAANTDLMSRGFDINEKDKEFITNLAKMDNGKMTIEIPKSLSDQFAGQSKITLDSLTSEQYKALKENREKLEAMNPQDIARDQLSEIQNIGRDVAAMWQLQKIQATRLIGEKLLGENLQKAEKEMREYSSNFIKENRGVLSGENKEAAAEKLRELENSPIYQKLKAEVSTLGDVIGRSDMAQKIKDSLNNLLKNETSSTETNNTSNNTQTVNHVHTIAAGNNVQEEYARALLKNPTVMNEWVASNNPRRYGQMKKLKK